MKKLVFAAIAAMVMVSVSNVFANESQTNIGTTLPADTTVSDSIQPTEQPAEQPTEQPAEQPTSTVSADTVQQAN